MTDPIAYRPALIQHGYQDSFSSAWIEFDLPDAVGAPDTFAINASGMYTQVYDFGLDFHPDTGKALDPPVFFTQASQGLYYSLELSTDRTTVSGLNVSFSYHHTATPALISDSNKPFDHSPKTNLATAATHTWTLNGSTYDLQADIDFNTQIVRAGGARPDYSVQSLINHRNWNGYLILHLMYVDLVPWAINNPSTYTSGFLAGQYIPAMTGWAGRTGGRPINDMKTGMPTDTDSVREDGYYQGVWTQDASWDADDPRHIRSVEFPPDEGTRKDDVPA